VMQHIFFAKIKEQIQLIREKLSLWCHPKLLFPELLFEW
jgi:hypothetical protein